MRRRGVQTPKGKVMQLVLERGAFRFMSADKAKELYDKIAPRLTALIDCDRKQLERTKIRGYADYPLADDLTAYRWKPPGKKGLRPTFARFLAIYKIKLTEGV